MRRTLVLFLVSGCTAVEPSQGLLPPTSPPAVAPTESTTQSDEGLVEAGAKPAEAEVPDAPADDAFGATLEEPTDAPAGEPAALTDGELLARSLGVTPTPHHAPPADTVSMAGSWGVRLVATLAEAQPPRAVLGLGTGDERVVQPGDWVAEERILVLAIGRDAVQIAHVRPEGDRARIQTEVLSPLYGARAPVPLAPQPAPVPVPAPLVPKVPEAP